MIGLSSLLEIAVSNSALDQVSGIRVFRPNRGFRVRLRTLGVFNNLAARGVRRPLRETLSLAATQRQQRRPTKYDAF